MYFNLQKDMKSEAEKNKEIKEKKSVFERKNSSDQLNEKEKDKDSKYRSFCRFSEDSY